MLNSSPRRPALISADRETLDGEEYFERAGRRVRPACGWVLLEAVQLGLRDGDKQA
jgi:hypothetical protein